MEMLLGRSLFMRYKEDIALMAEMGLDSLPFFHCVGQGIYPNGDGELNQKGLDFLQ